MKSREGHGRPLNQDQAASLISEIQAQGQDLSTNSASGYQTLQAQTAEHSQGLQLPLPAGYHNRSV